MRKIPLFLLLPLVLLSLVACDKDNDDDDEYTVLWTPALELSTIGDGCVTVGWTSNTKYFTKSAIMPNCVIPNFARPQRLEIHRADKAEGPFTLIADMKYQEGDVKHTITGLPNGKPIYIQVKSIRKGYEPTTTPAYIFIPNPEPKSEILVEMDRRNHNNLVLSPDKQKYAYIGYSQNTNILYLNTGNSVEEIAHSVYLPFWSNDGEILYFITYNDANNTPLQSYNCKTKTLTVLKNTIPYHRVPAISPDGTKILFNTQGSQGMNLYVYDCVTQRDSLLLNGENTGMSYIDPSWINNDTYLVNSRKMLPPYTTELLSVSLEDGTAKAFPLEYSNGYNSASLSPDGKHIAFCSWEAVYPRLMIFNIQNGSLRQLTGYQSGTQVYDMHTVRWIDNRTISFTEHDSLQDKECAVVLTIP